VCIQGIELSYTTCTTTFNGEEGQAVFASIVNDTVLGTARALCVVHGPFQDEDHPSLEARIEVSQARGPGSKPEKSTAFSVQLSQTPVVDLGQLQYATGQRFGSVLVQVTHIEGTVKVRHVTSYNSFAAKGSAALHSLACMLPIANTLGVRLCSYG
jgi:hypothetical protein